jgi:hypothetical protein
MSVASTHANYVIEKYLIENLQNGIILTTDELKEYLEIYQKNHLSLSVSISKDIDFSVEHGAESSAELIQTIANAVSDDITIVSRELKDLVGRAQSYYERWTVEVQRLINKAKRLEYQIDTLLLLQSDTAGYFAHISDNFTNLNKIDMENTNAKVDIRETTVTLNPYSAYSSDASGGTRIDLSDLTEYDVTFSILSTTPGGYSSTGESVPLNAIKSPGVDGYCWVGIVSQSKPGPITTELKIRLSKTEDKEVSRILFDCGVQNAGGNPNITCQWSLDGYQWYMVDDPSVTKSLQGGTASWIFPVTNMRWIKFLIIKNNYDFKSSGSYEYDFGARSIRLFGHQYEITSSSVLYTLPQQAIDAEGEPVVFTLASFEACEQHAFDKTGNQLTNILYNLSASEDGKTNWTEWVRVDSALKESPEYPSAILFGNSRKLDNIDYNIDEEDYMLPFDNSINNLYKLTKVFDWGTTGTPQYLGYNFKSADFAVINTAIIQYNPITGYSVDNILNPNYLASSTEVWRNIFDPSLDSIGRTVRGINAGWGLDGDEYYCSFYINNSDGIILDFGHTTCVIDGVTRTGETKIYRGAHTFRTALKNWEDYSSNYAAIGTDTELAAIDILYPYNHKMIIEGFPYTTDFEGEQVYTGVDIVAQFYAKRISAFDLENNIKKEDALQYFAFVKGVGINEAPSCAILLRRDLNYDDYSNEYCRILWKLGEGSFRYIRMRAEFSSTDTNYTSVLSSYRIKVGI